LRISNDARARLRVEERRVPVAERAALDVLAGQPDRRAVLEHGRERQFLGGGPVDRPIGRRVERLAPALARPFELAVDGEAIRHDEQRVVQRAQPFERDGGPRLGRGTRRRHFGRRLDEVLLGIERVVGRLQRVHALGEELLGVAGLDAAARLQRARPALAHRRLLGDLPVHDRLGERGLVALVVAVAAIADQVDQHVAVEPRAIAEREPRRGEARLGVVGVHVHDRNLEPAREPARVERAERVVRVGREADLVVGDDVDRAARGVAGEAVQVQRLGNDPLSGERGVAMNEDGQDGVRVEPRRAGRARVGAGRARHALEHRVDRLEVARVRRHRDDELDALAAAHRARRAQVVLDVAAPLHALDRQRVADRVLELGQDLRVRLAEHVRHDVQPAAVRHADERLPHAGLGRLGDDLVEHGHEHVEPFDRKPRLARERAMEEALEHLDVGQPVEQRNGIDRIGGRAVAAALDGLAQPVPFVRHENVRKIVPRRRAVDRLQPLDDVPHRLGALGDGAGDDRRGQRAEVGLGDAVRLGQQRVIAERPAAERVDARGEVAVAADGLRQVARADDDVEVQRGGQVRHGLAGRMRRGPARRGRHAKQRPRVRIDR
jgi:hypothetical protein